MSEIVGADLFCKLLGTDKFLPSENIDSKILEKQIFEQVEHITNDIIHCKLENNLDLNEWYIHADKETKNIFNKWVIENDYKDVINSLPIFEFDDGCKSPNEIAENDNYIVISTKFSHLKNIIVKLGLHCSNLFDNENLYQIDETILFNRIYKKIEKYNQIVKDLHHYMDICAGTGEDDYYYVNYYQSLISDLKESNFFTREQIKILAEIKPDYLAKEDGIEMSIEGLDGINDMSYNHYIFNDLPNAITQIINETALTPREKLTFINTDFYGIGDAKIKEIELFYNINNAAFYNGGEPAPLQNMLSYRNDAPDYIKPYMICEEENFPELQKYLICSENEFENVIMPHLNEIVGRWNGCSLSDVIAQYNLEGQQLRELINEYSSDYSLKELLTFVEDSDKNTKEHFLNKIEKLDLQSTSNYKKDSYEYRVLRLVLDVFVKPFDFSSKIYFDGQCIKDFSVSDDVICEYTQNGETKKVKMSLAKLLPKYQNQSDSIEKIKALFESKKDLDKFFIAKPKSVFDIDIELNQLLGVPETYFSSWNVNGNALQYLFATYYRRHIKGWNNLYVPKIDLSKETESFVHELLDFICNNNILIDESPFTYHLKKYFDDKYFASDYVFDNEQILSIIEQWANDDNKKKYLADNDVHTEKCNAIQFRKLFLEDKPVDFIDKRSDGDIKSGIEFVATANGFDRPFVGENQKKVLLSLKDKCQDLSDIWCSKKMEEKSKECDTKEYNEWIEGHILQIFIYPGILPKQLSYNDEVLLNYDDEESNYYYDKQGQKLFVSNARKIEDVLFEVVKGRQSDFDLNDYKELCLDGKISVSKEDIEKKDKEIETLEESNRKKDEIINDLKLQISRLENQKEQFIGEVPTIKLGTTPALSEKERIDAQIDAQKKLKEIYPSWEYPNGFGEGGCYSCFNIKKTSGEIMSIVLKSHNTSAPLHVNTNEWDWIMGKKEPKFLFSDDGVFQQDYPVLPAKLFIYTGDDIKELDPKYLIENQPSIALSFSTENLDIEDRITAFSDSLHYFKGMNFDFESFNLSSKAKSIKGLYNKNLNEKQNTENNSINDLL